jgi:DNA modification methylase
MEDMDKGIEGSGIGVFINRVIRGNCLEVMRGMSGDSIDAVITSPPYNVGVLYDEYRDDMDFGEYKEYMRGILGEIGRVLKVGGRVMINLAPACGLYYPTHHIISGIMLELGFIWKAEIIWNKNNYGCSYTTWGSWRSPSSPYIKTGYEYINVYCKGSLKKEGRKEDIDITEEEFKRWTDGLWNVTPETKMRRYGHPAMFPEEIPRRLMKLFTYRSDVILDPFCGVGTTCLVAKKLGRKYIGIDISEKYCEIAERRIRNASLEVSLFDADTESGELKVKS